jgi:hypothetical protein
MPEIEDELVARAIAWCSEAGRFVAEGEVRAALAKLGWDELLATRALLADPPTARPLGPLALVDIARGATPEMAAQREREGRYALPCPPAREASGTLGQARPQGKRGSGGPFIRRVRDRVEPGPASEPASLPLPPLGELFASEGRATLERLVREKGARRGRIIAALSVGWRRPDGSPPGEEDLAQLLDVHGLTRGFERRERDELLHALRAAAGLRTRAATALGLSAAAFEASLERLGGTREAESIRAAHRDELRRRATLSERVHMLLGEAERLDDLGLLAEVEADVRGRLPQHVRALRASGAAPLTTALARSLAVLPRDISALVARLGLHFGEPGAEASSPSSTSAPERKARPSERRPESVRRRPVGSSPVRDRPDRARGPAATGQQRRGGPGDRARSGDARRQPAGPGGGAKGSRPPPKAPAAGPARGSKRGGAPRRS